MSDKFIDKTRLNADNSTNVVAMASIGVAVDFGLRSLVRFGWHHE